MSLSPRRSSMSRRLWAILNTALFTIFVPGTVAILINSSMADGRILVACQRPLDVARSPAFCLRCRDLLPLCMGIRGARPGNTRAHCADQVSGHDRAASIRTQPDVPGSGVGDSWTSCHVSLAARRRVRGGPANDRACVCCSVRGTHAVAAVRGII